MGSYRPSIHYVFVRGRQLEGTFPGDKQTGVWPITSLRVHYGWGAPPEEAWPYPASDAPWPSVEPEGIDLLAKEHRQFPLYRRIRTISECIDSSKSGLGVMVSLDITDKWAMPSGGIIPDPSATDIMLPTHHIVVEEYDHASSLFKFNNSWGPRWGDRGYGYISAEALKRTWWEAWTFIPDLHANTPPSGVFPLRAWAFKDVSGSIVHWLEIAGEHDERLGWASAVENDKSVEIEELFIRPRYRRVGHGRKLFETVHKMAQGRHKSFRIWISFADTAPENLQVIGRIIKPVGLSLQFSGVRWAPLVASPLWGQRKEPVQRFAYRQKPPSIPSELVKVAYDVAVGLGTGIVSSFLCDAAKSWFRPENRNKIRAKLGGLELETSEVSPDQFLKLFKGLRDVKELAEVRSKLLEMGIQITVVNQRVEESARRREHLQKNNPTEAE